MSMKVEIYLEDTMETNIIGSAMMQLQKYRAEQEAIRLAEYEAKQATRDGAQLALDLDA